MKRSVGYVAVLLLGACGMSPESVSWSDARLAPLIAAIESRNDRSALGFTPIDTASEVRLEVATDRAYDVMLHICGKTSRTVAFRKTVAGYEWIGEQETHRGPGKIETPDGQIDEHVTLTFDTAPISGTPIGALHIGYIGPDDTLMSKSSLRYGDVAARIDAWAKASLSICETQQRAAADVRNARG
jgi:hypothetical protein